MFINLFGKWVSRMVSMTWPHFAPRLLAREICFSFFLKLYLFTYLYGFGCSSRYRNKPCGFVSVKSNKSTQIIHFKKHENFSIAKLGYELSRCKICYFQHFGNLSGQYISYSCPFFTIVELFSQLTPVSSFSPNLALLIWWPLLRSKSKSHNWGS